MNPRREPEPEPASVLRLGHCDWTDQPALTVDLPTLPAGTMLHLRPEKWYVAPERIAYHELHVRVVDVQPAVEPNMVWVRAHMPECRWTDSDCTGPWCHEALVPVDELRRVLP